jgi:hypothetical protein
MYEVSGQVIISYIVTRREQEIKISRDGAAGI